MSARPLRFFPIAFSHFKHHDDLEAGPEVAGIAELLAEFGAQPVAWDVPMEARGADAVTDRLTELQDVPEPCDTFVYWLGHGWSNGPSGALAHALSPPDYRATGIRPDGFAEALAALQSHRHTTASWAIVVIEACKSAQFVRLLNSALERETSLPRRLLLVGVSGAGGTRPGEFREALDFVVNNTYRASDIPLLDLVRELERLLPEAAEVRPIKVSEALLERRTAVPSGVTLDVFGPVKAALSRLSTDEQRHFIPKAQGAELGEIAWYFEGRERERRAISHWLRDSDGGVMVVTGPAGSGKSALLGHLVEQSRPELRAVLIEAGLIEPVPPLDRPPDDIFDAVVHLTGITTAGLLEQLATAFEFEPLAPGQSVTAQAKGLLRRLRARGGRQTILLDALDEAQQPFEIAREIIRKLGRVPGVRVLVGTRSSTLDSPDHPTPSGRDLLDALGLAEEIPVRSDPAAVARYVAKRLRAHVSASPKLHRMISDISEQIGGQNRQFLFARLAVHELLVQPSLVEDTHAVAGLLASDHRDLFATAVDRLTSIDPAHGPLLEALGLARGRGLPIRDGLWSRVAQALDQDVAITEQHISDLLKRAAPYLTVDVEHDQTVYRLAHATFAEHYGEPPERHLAIVEALAELAERDPREDLNPYLRKYLPAHAALADPQAWQELADRTWTLDRLDPTAVATNAMRALFGAHSVPPEIAGVIGAQHLLREQRPSERLGNRQLGMALYGRVRQPPGYPAKTPVRPSWSVRWAHLTPFPIHLALGGRLGGVRGLVVLTDPDGRTLLASGDKDGSIQLWDPINSQQVGEPLIDSAAEVRSMTAFTGADGRTLLAAGHGDGAIRIWDPFGGNRIGRIMSNRDTGQWGAVEAIVAFTTVDGRILLAVGASDGTVQRWDPATGERVGALLAGNRILIRGMTLFPGPDGHELVATCSDNGIVRIWDMALDEPVGEIVYQCNTRIGPIAAFTGPDGRPLLAFGHQDNTITIWDPTAGVEFGTPLVGAKGRVLAIEAVVGPDGQMLVVSTGDDRAIRIWDLLSGQQVRKPFTGHTALVRTLATFTGPSGQLMIASAGADGTIRVWDLAVTDHPEDAPALGGEHVSLATMTELVGPAGRNHLLYCGTDGIARFWDTATSRDPRTVVIGHRSYLSNAMPYVDAYGRMLFASTGHDQTIRLWTPFGFKPGARYNPSVKDAAGSVPLGTLLVTGGSDGKVQILDPVTGDLIGAPIVGATGDDPTIVAVAAITSIPSRPLVAAGSTDGTVRVWNPSTGEPVIDPILGELGRILALTTFQGTYGPARLAGGGSDGVVRLWDPTTGAAVGGAIKVGPAVVALTAFTTPTGTTLLAAGCTDGTVRILDPATDSVVGDPIHAHIGKVFCLVAFPGPDGGALLATGGADATVRIWDATTRLPAAKPLTGHVGAVRAMTTYPDPSGGWLLATAGNDGTVRLWDPAIARQIGKPFTGRVLALASFVGAGGRAILAGTETDGRIHFWDTVSGLQAGEAATGHTGAVSAMISFESLEVPELLDDAHHRPQDGSLVTLNVMEYSDSTMRCLAVVPTPSGRVLVTANNYTIAMWDTATGRRVGKLRSHEMPGQISDATAFWTADGHLLLAAACGHRIRTWDLLSRQEVTPSLTQPSAIRAITTFRTPDGFPRLATGSDDRTVSIWDPEVPHEPEKVLLGHSGAVLTVLAVRSAAGQTVLASAGSDRTVRLWDPFTPTPIQVLRLPAKITALARTSHGLVAATPVGLVEITSTALD